MNKQITGVLAKRTSEGLSLQKHILQYESYKSLYPVINCDLFDIPTRYIKGKPFDIYLDDEGLLKGKPVVAASDDGLEVLVGNLFFCKHNDHGGIESLTDEEVNLILLSIEEDFEGSRVVSYGFKEE